MDKGVVDTLLSFSEAGLFLAKQDKDSCCDVLNRGVDEGCCR